MNIAIWGAGNFGKKLGNLIKDRLIYDRLVCFIDVDKNKWCDDMSNTVISALQAALMLERGLIDVIVVPGYEPSVLREIMQKLFQYNVDYKKYLFYADFVWFEEMILTKRIQSFDKLMLCADEKLPLIGALEYEISERCNLNCKRCNHYSNIFSDGKMIPLDVFKKDMNSLAELVYNVKRFKLLGGEPLLNDELYRYAECAREVLPNAYIAIVTNGTLIKSQSDVLWETLRKNDVVMEISIYPPMKEKVDELKLFLDRRNVKNKIFRYGDEFGAFLNMNGDSDKEWAMMKCYAQVCHAVKNGKLFKCTSVQNISVFNKEYDTNIPESFLSLQEILNKTARGKMLREYLMGTIEMCRYCTKFIYYPWEITNGDARKEDWIAINDNNK